MPNDYSSDGDPVEMRQTAGPTALAEKAVYLLRQRRPISSMGARQFILDHLLRAVISKGDFDAESVLIELRGHRLQVDTIIDTYVPATARNLGEMWVNDDLDFATVTIGAMRLQSLLSCASSESADLYRPMQNSQHVLIVIPEGEQHFLGAFVLAAQVRRMGCRVDVSFSELREDLIGRILCEPIDKIMITCSRVSDLESVCEIVDDIRMKVTQTPAIVLGGAFERKPEDKTMTAGVDLITNSAKEAVTYELAEKPISKDQASS